MSQKTTDKDRLDFLQSLNDKAKYTGTCILRFSETERGWRLHETSRRDSFANVRNAIDHFMREHSESNNEKCQILSKILDELKSQNISVEKVYMNQESKQLFTTGDESVDIVIENRLPTKKFVYLRPGEEYNPDNCIEYLVRVGNADVFKDSFSKFFK